MPNTSGGRDEMGESALRSFNSPTDSSNDLISVSMACCKRFREFAWLGFIKKWNGVTALHGWQEGIGSLGAYLHVFAVSPPQSAFWCSRKHSHSRRYNKKLLY